MWPTTCNKYVDFENVNVVGHTFYLFVCLFHICLHVVGHTFYPFFIYDTGFGAGGPPPVYGILRPPPPPCGACRAAFLGIVAGGDDVVVLAVPWRGDDSLNNAALSRRT